MSALFPSTSSVTSGSVTFPKPELAELFPRPNYKDTDRYEQLAGYFPRYAKKLQKTGCTLQVLWKEYLEAHPDDGYRYTQFVTYFASGRERRGPAEFEP